MRRILGLMLFLLAAPLAAQNGEGEPFVEEYDPRDFTCPLGGERFRQDVGYFAYPLETLPDGSRLGDIAIGAQIPECPGNGLVILPDFAAMEASESLGMAYHAYSAAELARLPALIADPEYAALKADGRHAQAFWLAIQLDRPALERFVLLQRATWAALAPELRRKLVAEFVAQAPALIAASDASEQWKRFKTGYVVNGLRELGRFEEALALLDRLEGGGAVSAPADPGDMFGAELGPAMRLAIAQKDDGRFPIELLDGGTARMICGGEIAPPYDQRTPANIAACETRREREAREAEADKLEFAEMREWQAKPEELDRACAATPPAVRSPGLERACSVIQREKDDRAGDALLLDQARQVSEDCERVPLAEREGPLFFACVVYENAVERAVVDLLADDDDDEAYAVVCFEGGRGDDSGDMTEIQRLCSSAKDERDRREEAILLADPAALDAKCAATAEDNRAGGLLGACLTREFDIARAEREAVASDERAFERRCGSVPDADADAMSDADFSAAIFCEDVRRSRQLAEEEAAGLSCMDDIELELEPALELDPDLPAEAEGEENEGRPGRICFPRSDPSAQDGGPSVPGYDDDDSELSQIAREKAAQWIAAAIVGADGR